MSYNYKEPEYNLVTLDRFSKTETILFSVHEFPAGRVVPVHWHNFIELEIVLGGEADYMVNNKSSVLTKGSAYIMTSCDFHTLSPRSTLTILNLSIMRGIIDPMLENFVESGVGKIHCTLDDAQLTQITDMFRRGQDETGSEPFSALIKKNIAEELIISLIRASRIDESASDPPLVQKAIIIVNDRFMNQLTLKDVANELFVSPNYLGTLFKGKVGVSFNCYVTMIRLRYACGLLDSTNKTVKEIALESGFGSTEYFISVFKKFMKMTPASWRCGEEPLRI